MRILSNKLAITGIQKASEWIGPSSIGYDISFLDFHSMNDTDYFFLFDPTDRTLYRSRYLMHDGRQHIATWVSMGAIDTSYAIKPVALFGDIGLALGNPQILSSITSYRGYSMWASSSWGNFKTLSTSGNWTNCHITNIIPVYDGILAIGYKEVNSEKVGIYSKFYLNNSSYVFSTPVTLETSVINNGVCTGYKCVLVGNDGYIATTQDIRDTSHTWSVSQAGNKNWLSVAYGDDLFVAVSNDGYITISSDNGVNWSEPERVINNTSLNKKIIYAKDKFYLAADEYVLPISINNDTSGLTISTGVLSKINTNNGGAWTQMCYDDNFEYLFIGNSGGYICRKDL